ncbi:2-isopropylmalate synthase (Alpha-isopropylmalate synthase) (Alpha-IPM synthetase) [Elasticomyces elasticus]|uniref:2-isopropylmalate synthase n=1 Tax=Elasticomyces elasticus TaxID=574655 RepID=A0AAN7ZV35_9PEZI|nr:2-isopropylmalate synthase (Alpha-isopropylmalate synthase) (Alpha-IPM synthetase) [Elasticomyces elasticus]
MVMLKDPSKKYRRFPPLSLPDRQWPSKTIDKVPRWLATDLRDGNQSLVDPMDGDQKFRYFQMLVQLGYKEIEVSFPSSGPTDYDFTRRLVTTPGVVPDDVWLQVLSPCRKELIRRTVDSLKGSKKAVLHLYLATSPCFQQVVFGMTNEQSKALAVECTKYARSITKDDPSSGVEEWAYEFSPECFSDSNMDFVLDLCEAVKSAWEPSESQPIIFNLPATVEMSTPNVYADQIEFFCRNITERSKICVSLHPHNDRGCAVAAAELAQMAGADRVEGTLFGNGERTGNVDLVTLALNLYTQGIHPGIDFSDLNSVIDIVETSNKIPVHPRQPYGGQLVVCAFSGSHQDAIKKGFSARESSGATREDPWVMPYLPLDPEDIGRTYEAIIRVNSQSGKGGVAWIIKRTLELDLPRGLQIAFSKIVQRETDMLGRELLPGEIKELFVEAYHLNRNPRFGLVDYSITTEKGLGEGEGVAVQQQQQQQQQTTTTGTTAEKAKTAPSRNLRRKFTGVIEIDGHEHHIEGVGNGALSALAAALKNLGIDLDIADYKEHSIERRGGEGTGVKGRDTQAATFIECTASGQAQKVWGVGIHEDVVQSSLFALLSAASSFLSSRPSTPVPFRPKRSNTLDMEPGSPLTGLRNETNAAPKSSPDAVAKLEAVVGEGEQKNEAVEGKEEVGGKENGEVGGKENGVPAA